jgi:acetolactate synthase-1/2/3 large subunit
MDCKTKDDVTEILSIYNSQLEKNFSQSNELPFELISQIHSAKRPLLVLGNASRIASVPSDSISQLIDHLGFPVLLTWASMDLLDYNNQKVFGCAGGLAGIHSNRIIQTADLIIFLGVRLDLLTTGFNPQAYGKNARRFVFDCDEAELGKFSGATGFTCVLSDIRAAVRALLEIPFYESNALSSWMAQCKTWQNENQKCEEHEFSSRQLNTYHVASLVAQSAVTRYVVPTASGYAIEGFARFYKTTNGSRFSWAGHVLGSMGLAIPSAIGASVRLKKTVACVDGDGGFLLNMQELYTLRANPDIYIVFFILNNRGYASISQSQTRNFQKNFGASTKSGLAEIDFESLAKIADLKYMECKTYDSLKDAISCLNSESRVLINIFLDGDDYRGPSITTKFDSQGRPFSTELEDISWR